MVKINPVLKWWLSPKLPKEHLFVSSGQPLKKYLAHYLVHPLRRRIAKYYLFLLKRIFGVKVIAITGSAGKTTVKEMVASILKEQGRVSATFENIDPVYNIPQTILQSTPLTRFLVLEMGVEFKGEMDYYLWLAKPDIAVVTNIYPTHTLYFDNIEGVAKEKSKLPLSLNGKNIAVLNKDNEFTKKMGKKTKAETIWFGSKGDVYAEKVSFTESLNTKFTLIYKKNKIIIQLPILGKQFVQDAVAASAAALACKVSASSVKKGLENYKRPKHRMKLIKHKSGALILDDSYNNNPEAAIRTIDTLAEVSRGRKKVVVMGDMLELGGYEKKSHKRVGSYIAKKGIDHLIGVGPASRQMVKEAKAKSESIKTKWVKDYKKVFKKLKPLLNDKAIILVKGSRSIELEKVVAKLLQ